MTLGPTTPPGRCERCDSEQHLEYVDVCTDANGDLETVTLCSSCVQLLAIDMRDWLGREGEL
jgi:hypothetical protein